MTDRCDQFHAVRCHFSKAFHTIQAAPQAMTWGVITLAVLATLTGCVSTIDVKPGKTDVRSASSYLASKGTTNAQNRIEAQLAESSQKRRERVFWGGVAIAGGDQESDKNLPLCSDASLLREFEQSVSEKLGAVHPAQFDLQNTGAGPARADNWKDQDA